MKYIWEAQDIIHGRYVTKKVGPGGLGPDALGYLASVTHKIGYIPTDSGNDWCLISVADGMVCAQTTNTIEFAEKLNGGDYIPIHTDLLVKVIAHLAPCNEGRAR